VKVGESDALAVQPIDVGRFHDRIAGAAGVAVTQIVRENENDVGTLAGQGNCFPTCYRKKPNENDPCDPELHASDAFPWHGLPARAEGIKR
jgi:hypothetical protein